MINRLLRLARHYLYLTARLAMCVFRVFPFEKDTVLMESFGGEQYSCNPRYLSDELRRVGGTRIVWALNEPEKFNIPCEKVKRMSLRWLKLTQTAGTVITNGNFTPWIPARKGQMQLRTWHGGGAYKQIGLMEPSCDDVRAKKILLFASDATLYLSSSRMFTEKVIRDSLGYRGEVLEAGMPRNDVLLRGGRELKGAVKKRLGFSAETHLALYAPTFRRGNGKDEFRLDYETVRDSLAKRFGGEWAMLYRGHHVGSEDARGRAGAFCNVTEYGDMQELLIAADVLITDYSSCMWDMSLTGKPVFLYCTDLKAYTRGRDFVTDIRTWPYPLAENNAELAANILAFDEAGYAARIAAHHDLLGSCETGAATAKTVERILRHITEAG